MFSSENGPRRHVIAIGASAGGVGTLIELFERLPGSLDAAVAVVLHMNPLFNSQLATILARHTALRVVPAVHGMPLELGTVYVAVPDIHLRLAPGRIVLDRGPKAHYTRPAVDPLFISAAQAYAEAVVGVLLSGNGMDGVSGLVAIKQRGGVSVVQDPSEAKYPSMPTKAIQEDHVDAVLPVAKLADALHRMAEGKSLDPSAVRYETR